MGSLRRECLREVKLVSSSCILLLLNHALICGKIQTLMTMLHHKTIKALRYVEIGLQTLRHLKYPLVLISTICLHVLEHHVGVVSSRVDPI